MDGVSSTILPVFGIILFANRYDAATATVTTTVVLSTGLAIITVPVAIYPTAG